MSTYLVATTKPWNIRAYESRVGVLPGEWVLVTNPVDLDKKLAEISPRYIFFPHWSWIVPEGITNKYECVCFHMTDLPYGRGGSPLQNLIVRGHKDTMLTALKMTKEIDAGPVYAKKGLSLAGSARQIFERTADLVYDLVSYIVNGEPEPQEQVGEPTLFSRRTPDQSRLPESGSMEILYDHIRMLDADTYPRAFLEYGEFHLEFSDANLQGDSLSCRVIVKKVAE